MWCSLKRNKKLINEPRSLSAFAEDHGFYPWMNANDASADVRTYGILADTLRLILRRKGWHLSVFILVSVLTISGYCLDQPIQKTIWLDDRYSALYPENVYLIGVGKVQIIREEYPEREADIAAKSDLANKIRAMLEQTTMDIFKDKTPGDITDIVEIATKETIKTLLGKVTIGARWIDKKDNSLYSLAVVKYSQIAQGLDKQSEKVNNSAEKQYKLAEKYFKKKKLLSAIEEYLQTLQLLDEFTLYSSLLQSLPDRFDIKKRIKVRKVFISTVKIEEKIENIISALSLKKISGDTQEVSSGFLSQHITVKVFYNIKPVEDFPVNFFLPDGNAVYTPHSRTDDKGIAKCLISNISEGKKVNRVQVTLNLPIDAEGRESSVSKWQKQLAKKQVGFIYFIFSPKEFREWIDDVALSIEKQIEKYGKLSIVIEDFVMNDGTKNKLCRYFPDILASQLSSIGREYLTLKRIHEVKKKRKELVLTGIFTEVGSGITLTTRLDNYKGKYVAGSNITAQRTAEINNLLGKETTEPVIEETLPGPLYQPATSPASVPVREKQPKYIYEFEEEVGSVPEKEEKIKEKPVNAEITLPDEKKEEGTIIRLKKKKEESTAPKKRKKPKIKIID